MQLMEPSAVHVTFGKEEVQAFKQEEEVQTFKQQEEVQAFKLEEEVQTFKQEEEVQTFKQQEEVQTFKKQEEVQTFKQEEVQMFRHVEVQTFEQQEVQMFREEDVQILMEEIQEVRVFQSPVTLSEVMTSNGFCLANSETILFDLTPPTQEVLTQSDDPTGRRPSVGTEVCLQLCHPSVSPHLLRGFTGRMGQLMKRRSFRRNAAPPP